MSYWAFIDTKFDELQLQCAKPTEKETQRLIEDMLKGNLKDDQSRYKGPASGATKLPAKIHLPEWQQDHAQAVKDMSAYTVDPSVDDDIDDDDSTIEAPATEALLCADDTIEDLGNADDTEEDLGSSHFNPLARSADVDENKRDWRSEKGSLLTSDESPAKAEAEVSMPAPGVEHSQLQRSPNYSIPPVNLPPLPSVLPSSTRWNTTFIPDPPRAVGDRYTPSWPLSSDNIPDLWEPTLMEHNLARSFQELDIRSSSIDWQPKPSRSIFSQSGTSNQARQQTKSRVPNRATLQDFERLVQYPSGNQDMLLLYVGTDSKYTLASNHAALMVRQSARSPDFLRRLQEATISLSLIAEFVEFIFSCKHLKPEQRGCLALRVCFSSLTALMGDFGSGEAPASDPNVPIVMRAALGTFRQCYDPVTLVIASLVEKLSKSINMYRYRRSPSTSVACKFQSMLRTLETWNVGLDDRTFHEPIAIIQSWLTSHSNQVSSNWVRGTNVQSSPNMSETISSPAQATSGSSVKPLENIPDACEPQPTQSNL
ncbi:hypothetical protein BDV93DRAFT_529984 [Ceratobasidium sp. AG-I]|nr:hypothetical protein BDV93DRAFT_529984 [Ceratobasidium sp. AG-I]